VKAIRADSDTETLQNVPTS